jgi:hypothetical protein
VGGSRSRKACLAAGAEEPRSRASIPSWGFAQARAPPRAPSSPPTSRRSNDLGAPVPRSAALTFVLRCVMITEPPGAAAHAKRSSTLLPARLLAGLVGRRSGARMKREGRKSLAPRLAPIGRRWAEQASPTEVSSSLLTLALAPCKSTARKGPAGNLAVSTSSAAGTRPSVASSRGIFTKAHTKLISDTLHQSPLQVLYSTSCPTRSSQPPFSQLLLHPSPQPPRNSSTISASLPGET